LLVVAALGIRPGVASAHAQLERSDPAENALLNTAPEAVTLYFSEEPELRFTRVEVTDASGARVDLDDLDRRLGQRTAATVSLKPTLPDGAYVVVWKALSAVDGHTTRGNFAFFVGERVEAPSVPSSGSDGGAVPDWFAVLGRWLTIVALSLALGIGTYPAFVYGPASRSANADAPAVSRLLRGMLALSIVLTIVSALVALWVQAWSAGGDASSVINATLRDVLFDTRFGDTWFVRAAFTLVFVALACVAFARPRHLLSAGPIALATLAVSLVLPATVSVNSHANGLADWPKLGVFLDWLHITTAGIWVGGLIMFSALLLPIVRGLEGGRRLALLAAVIPRFSVMAVVVVTALVAAGVAEWWLLVGDVGDTVDSNYGRTLIVKSFLLAPLLALGAANLLVISPRLRTLVRSSASAPGPWASRFASTVRLELVLAAAVFVAAAILGNTSPPGGDASSVAASSGFTDTAISEGLEIELAVTPAAAGMNDIDVYLDGVGGNEPNVRDVLLRFTYAERDIGTTEDKAEGLHPTHFTLTGGQFSLAGRWEVEVIVRQRGANDARATFEPIIAPSQ
jgi:copper transport protein